MQLWLRIRQIHPLGHSHHSPVRQRRHHAEATSKSLQSAARTGFGDPAAPRHTSVFHCPVKSPVSELSPTACKPSRRRPHPGAQRDERPWPDEDTERARRAPTASKCIAGDSCSRRSRASQWPPPPQGRSRSPRSPSRAGPSRATSRPARMAASFRSSR